VTITEVTEEWRRTVSEAIEERRMSRRDLARRSNVSHAQVCMLLAGKVDRSALVDQINDALGIEQGTDCQEPNISRIAELRQADDAIAEDIARLETARDSIGDRLTEARQARTEIQLEIRQRRAQSRPTLLDDMRRLRVAVESQP